ncbi:MAG TPA: hypothetical protein EYP54_01350 [Anaerolineales bacterium]|nr:hypothetical protein [Anaerolineales bacterium]
MLIPGRPWSLGERLFAGTGVLWTLGTAGYGLWRAYFGYTKYGPAAAALWPRPYLLASALGALLTLAYAFPRWRRARALWRLTPQGISPGPRQPIIPWKEVQGLVTDFAPHHQRLHLLTAKGRWQITPVPQAIRQALSYLQVQLYPHLAARWRQTWEQGQAIPLGRWLAWPNGMQIGRRHIPWQEMQRLHLAQGHLVIELAHRSFRQPVHRVPNAALFIRWLYQEGHP